MQLSDILAQFEAFIKSEAFVKSVADISSKPENEECEFSGCRAVFLSLFLLKAKEEGNKISEENTVILNAL